MEAGVKQWVRRVRGALAMGVVWAMIWAPVAVLIGLIMDPDGSSDEMWPVIGAYPGFIGGVVFSVVLSIAARDRRFEELSVARFAGWGALAGAIVGSIPFTIGDPTSAVPLWFLAGTVIGSITLLSSLSAAGSLMLARRAERRQLLADPAGVYSSGHDEETDRRLAGVARDGAGAARGDRPQARG
jgi:hypothetical protein